MADMVTVSLKIPADKVADCANALADEMGVEKPTTSAQQLAIAQTWFTQQMITKRAIYLGRLANQNASAAALADWPAS